MRIASCCIVPEDTIINGDNIEVRDCWAQHPASRMKSSALPFWVANPSPAHAQRTAKPGVLGVAPAQSGSALKLKLHLIDRGMPPGGGAK